MHVVLTPQPPIQRYIPWVLAVHVVFLILTSLVLTNSIRTAPSMVMQVRLVGVPTPTQVPQKQERPPEEVRTQDSAAPKEPPPDAKDIPPSEAKTKLMTKVEELAKDKKDEKINAAKRPPVLDKNPNEKKVVKNDLDKKVVKNPEDYMKALDFLNKLEAQQLAPSPTLTAQPTDKPAGEGPQIQLDASDRGAVDAIREHIETNWVRPPGLKTDGMGAIIEVTVDIDGNVINQRVIESSGQAFYDDSLLRAVRKSIPLPIPRDKFDQFRVLELHFAG